MEALRRKNILSSFGVDRDCVAGASGKGHDCGLHTGAVFKQERTFGGHVQQVPGPHHLESTDAPSAAELPYFPYLLLFL